MCTLLLAAGVIPQHPLVVVANRDEQLDRPSAPPAWWPEGFFAPRDLVAGGTWLGLNKHGLFVAITNRFLGPRDTTRTSRGTLVTRALACRSAKEAHEHMATIDPTALNGFHLVYADAHDAMGTVGNGTSLAQLVLGRGVAIVTERSFGAADATSRLRRIHRAWSSAIKPPFDPLRLTKVLTEHDEADLLAATCIHVPEIGYGTRSAFALVTHDDGRPPTAFWADGPPCTTPFSPLPVGPIGVPTSDVPETAKTS
jgi:uncharacterized protein with NRDE domain